MNDQTTYALVRARIELQMAELREALDRHEESGRWSERAFLERVEAGLAELAGEVPRP